MVTLKILPFQFFIDRFHLHLCLHSPWLLRHKYKMYKSSAIQKCFTWWQYLSTTKDKVKTYSHLISIVLQNKKGNYIMGGKLWVQVALFCSTIWRSVKFKQLSCERSPSLEKSNIIGSLLSPTWPLSHFLWLFTRLQCENNFLNLK